MCIVKSFSDWGISRMKRFTVLDVAVFKFCLLSIGTLFGMYHARCCKKWAPLIWTVSLASYLFIIWRMVFCDDDA